MGAAAPVAWFTVALTAATTAYSINQQRQADKAQAAAARRSADHATQAATDAKLRGEVAVAEQRARTSALVAKQRLGFATSGVDVGTGSPLNVLEDSAAFGELEVHKIRSNAAREAWGYMIQSENILFGSGLSSSASRQSQAGTVLSGIAGIASQTPNLGLSGNTLSPLSTTSSVANPIGGNRFAI